MQKQIQRRTALTAGVILTVVTPLMCSLLITATGASLAPSYYLMIPRAAEWLGVAAQPAPTGVSANQ